MMRSDEEEEEKENVSRQLLMRMMSRFFVVVARFVWLARCLTWWFVIGWGEFGGGVRRLLKHRKSAIRHVIYARHPPVRTYLSSRQKASAFIFKLSSRPLAHQHQRKGDAQKIDFLFHKTARLLIVKVLAWKSITGKNAALANMSILVVGFGQQFCINYSLHNRNS